MPLRLILFELKFQFKQASYLLFSLFFLFSGIYLGIQEGALDPGNKYNIHLFVSIVSLLSVFQLVFQTSYTILRDQNYTMDTMIYASGVTKSNLLSSRYLGIIITSSISTLLYILGLYGALKIDFLDIYNSSNIFLTEFLWPWLIIVVPNILVISGLLFLTGIATKNSSLIFFIGLLLLITFGINNFYIGSPFTGGKLVVSEETVRSASIIDLFGICASYGQSQYWSSLDKSNRLIELGGLLLLNRFLIISITIVSLAISYKVFNFRISQKIGRKKSPKQETNPQIFVDYYPVLTFKNSLQAKILEFISLVKIDFRNSIYNKVFALTALVWVMLICGATSSNINGQEIFGNTKPTTGLLVGLILEPLAHIGLFVIIFYSGELLWKSRQYKFYEILDSTPANNNIILLAKYTSLFLMPVFIISLGIITALFYQTINAYESIDLMLYLKVFYYGGMPLFIYGVLSIFAHQFAPNKYLGMLLSLALIYMMGYGLPFFGFTHPLASLFQLPKMGEGFSTFNGFGTKASVFNWMSLVWIIPTLIILFITVKVYNRNTENIIKNKISLIFKNWTKSQQLLVGLLIVAFFMTAFIVDHMVENTKQNIRGTIAFDSREKYERKYKHFDGTVVPHIIDIKHNVDLFPSRMSYRVEGDYLVTNTHSKPIDTLIITAREILQDFSLQGAKTIDLDTSFVDFRLLVFDPPLLKGEKRLMHFVSNKTVSDFEIQRDIVTNGTYLRTSSFEPRFGYNPSLEIESPLERKQRNLPPKKDAQDQKQKHFDQSIKPKQNFEAWISTDKDQIALAPGNLISSKVGNDRKNYHYRSTEKVDNNLSFFSAKYETYTDYYQGIKIEIYFLREHQSVVYTIVKTIKATLKYGIENFGGYPFDHLRIAEVPLHWKFGGHALAGTIALQERFFTQDISKPLKGINQLSRVLIHEIGHQWFGHKMSPAPAPGANMLSESMANYMEAQVLEKMYGKTMVRRLANFSRRRYFNFRSHSKTPEPSLHLVNDEVHISYRKGFLMMQSLKELLGEALLNKLLRQVIEEHLTDQTAKSTDLLKLLYEHSNTHQDSLIKDWFENRFRYDLAIKEFQHLGKKNDFHHIQLNISSKRYQIQSDGVESQNHMDEDITLGLYNKYPDNINASPILQKIRLNGEETRIDLKLDSLPRYIVIDPMVTRLDLDVSDNEVEITN